MERHFEKIYMITIFTPTYNRANTIIRTYESLINQTCKDFEWLIVDDGSTDNTELLVQEWINNKSISIRYVKQSNGGKYRAYNNGLRLAKGEFFFCVDSDDWLPTNAIELILSYAERLRGEDTLAGIIALKLYKDETVIGLPYKKHGISSSLYDLELSGEGGERSIVFKTSIARMFPFPEETNEKFLGESVIYDRFHGKYEFIVFNDALTICEYQIDGLSSDPRAFMLHNPAGYKLYFAQRIDIAPSFYTRIGYVLRYHAFRLLYRGSAYDYKGKHKLLVNTLYPLGVFAKLFYTLVK